MDWLLEGDPAIRWQALKGLFNSSKEDIHKARVLIELEGWGKQLLDHQDKEGTWGGGLYDPQWTSTYWTITLLRRFGIIPGNEKLQNACLLLLNGGIRRDGGVNFFKSIEASEACYSGFMLANLSYFKIKDPRRESIFEYLIETQMSDGGWNCELPKGATHSSFHTTLIILEALKEYAAVDRKNISWIRNMQNQAHEFLLEHHLFLSHRSGKIVDSNMLKFSFPPRWHYNVLSALDYFQSIQHPYDDRFTDAIELLQDGEKEGKWNLGLKHKGQVWFEMEPPREQSRWITLKALRVLKWWEKVSKFKISI